MDDLPAAAATDDPGPADDAVTYRSYVVRVWSRPPAAARATRTQIEEVQSGHLVELRGGPAVEISARISAAFTTRPGGGRHCTWRVVAPGDVGGPRR